MTTPYYQDDWCTIYHGDSREVLPALRLKAVALVCTDAPYGIGWQPRVNHKDQPWKDERIDVSFALIGKHHCLWGGNYFTDLVSPAESWLVWIKRPDGFNFDNDSRSYSVCEMAWTDYGGKPRTKHLTWDGGMRAGDPSNRTFVHPAQKPLEVMRWSIDLCPERAGLVLDPFMGSGTTLRAAKDLGRSCIGIEIEERYCEIAANRLAQEVLDFGAGVS
jgi:site-specific DNA-methyltransferase (adenine-specific)